jgi:hypothetical protein
MAQQSEMSGKRSIFFDEWRACLRAHYIYVIQDNDTVTEPTLRAVLLQSGLSEDELYALAEEARAEKPLDTPASADGYSDEAPTANGQMMLF